MNQDLLKALKGNIREVFSEADELLIKNKASHWGVTHDGDIALIKVEPCNCLKDIAYICVPTQMDLFNLIDNGDFLPVENALKEISAEFNRDDAMKYYHRWYDCSCGCNQCEF